MEAIFNRCRPDPSTECWQVKIVFWECYLVVNSVNNPILEPDFEPIPGLYVVDSLVYFTIVAANPYACIATRFGFSNSA